MAHQIATVIVTVARVPLIPASKKVAVTYPLDVADCTCWLGQISMVLEQAVTVFVDMTASGGHTEWRLQDTPATPM